VPGVLVHGESWTVGGQLEEYAPWLLEVHGLEPEAIEHRRGLSARGLDLAPHDQLMPLIVHTPCEMMDAADAPGASTLVRRLADVDVTGGIAEAVSRPAVLVSDPLESEDVG
jgi:hypothetical protein